MKNLLLLFPATLFLYGGFAQNYRLIDSLQSVLQTSNEDTNKVNTLNELCLAKGNTAEYSDVKKYANDALRLAEKLDFKKGMARAYHFLGVFYWHVSDFNMALVYYQKAFTINKEIDYKKGIAWDLGDIGLTYSALGDYPKELDYFQQALKINELLKIQDAIAWNLRRIGIVYYNLSDFNKALEYFQKALVLEEKAGNNRGIASNMYRIGEVHVMEHNNLQALKKFQDALTIANEIDSREIAALIYQDLGNVYYLQGNYSEALKNYFSSIEIDKEIGDKNSLGASYASVAIIYTVNKKYQEAGKFLNMALLLSKETGSQVNYRLIYQGLTDLENARGNHKKALEYKDLYYVYRDSILNGTTSKKITTLQLQNDFDKKEEFTKAKNENELQKQKLIRNGFVCGFAVVLLFAGVFFHQRNKTKKEKKKSDDLLLNILPVEVASELKSSGKSKTKAFTMVTVMFTDFKDFTTVSEKISAELLVDEIHHCFSAFDYIIHKHKIEKIKTIGDAYLCASGLPVSNYSHAVDMLHAAFEIRSFMQQRKKEKEANGEIPFELRIGIHTGPVVAGIVGVKKYAYDIWGDTVNIAARMEQNCRSRKSKHQR